VCTTVKDIVLGAVLECVVGSCDTATVYQHK
jgi:hypothetical protein